MALTVPVMLSNDLKTPGTLGQAVFSDNAGGELCFDLRIAIPTVKLVEALLRLQNRMQDIEGPTNGTPTGEAANQHGEWEPLSLATESLSPQASSSPQAGTPQTKKKLRKVINAPLKKMDRSSTMESGQSQEETALILDGTGWDTPVPTPANLLPHFPQSQGQASLRWSKQDNGLVAWRTGQQQYDPPVANEMLLLSLKPKQLTVQPLQPKGPITPADHELAAQAHEAMQEERSSFGIQGMKELMQGIGVVSTAALASTVGVPLAPQ